VKKQAPLTHCGEKARQRIFEKVADPAGHAGGHLAGCPDCQKAARALEADLAALLKAARRNTPAMPGPVRLPVAASPKKPYWAFMPKPVMALAASLVLVLGLAVGAGILKTGGPPVVENPGVPLVAELADSGDENAPGDYSFDQTHTLNVDYLILAGEMDLLSGAGNDDEGSFFEDFLDFIAPLSGDDSFFQGRMQQKETSHV
jgi:hypothetical protein